jgi:hypothetical protein
MVQEKDVIKAYGLVSSKDIAAIIHCVKNADDGGLCAGRSGFAIVIFWGFYRTSKNSCV